MQSLSSAVAHSILYLKQETLYRYTLEDEVRLDSERDRERVRLSSPSPLSSFLYSLYPSDPFFAPLFSDADEFSTMRPS
jgi:hypothetical protein